MKKSRIIILSSAAAIITVSLITGGTIAYFTDKDQANNSFVCSSGIVGTLTEDQWTDDVNDKLIKDYVPGQTLKKNPVIHIDQKSGTDAFVGIKIECKWDDNTKQGKSVSLDDLVADYINVKWNTGSNSNQWTRYNNTNFYFYNSCVKKGSETQSALFDQITMKNEIYENYRRNHADAETIPDFHIIITGYAVQALEHDNTSITQDEKTELLKIAGIEE